MNTNDVVNFQEESMDLNALSLRKRDKKLPFIQKNKSGDFSADPKLNEFSISKQLDILKVVRTENNTPEKFFSAKKAEHSKSKMLDRNKITVTSYKHKKLHHGFFDAHMFRNVFANSELKQNLHEEEEPQEDQRNHELCQLERKVNIWGESNEGQSSRGNSLDLLLR